MGGAVKEGAEKAGDGAKKAEHAVKHIINNKMIISQL
jgi:hypothetical protein